MVNGDITVTPVFCVPVGHEKFADHVRLNQQLEALFLARETAEHRNPSPSHVPQDETFESRFNLFHWQEPCVQELRRFVLNAIGRMVLKTTSVTAETLAKLSLQNHTWFHISRYAGGFIGHNHPLASWSAVYCVRSGEVPPTHPESGVLRLFDPRAGAGAYTDLAIAELSRPYALSTLDVRLVEGQLLVFPSYIFHEVTPFYGRGVRITVATNCWFP